MPERVGAIVGEEMMPVVFVPRLSRESYAATLVITSNDPTHPELEVPLNGVGGVREIDVAPMMIDTSAHTTHAPRKRSMARLLAEGGFLLQNHSSYG